MDCCTTTAPRDGCNAIYCGSSFDPAEIEKPYAEKEQQAAPAGDGSDDL